MTSGVRRRRRQPGAQPAPPLGPAPLRGRHAARRRPHRGAGQVRPGGGHGGDRARAPDHDVLRPDPPPAPLRPLGRRRRPGPVVVPAGRPRRRPLPPSVKRRLVELFPDGSTWEFYGSTEGQFTACRSEDWLERPGTVGRARPGRAAHHRRRRPHLVRRAAARPVHLPRCPRADGRRMAGHARRAGVHRRRRRTHRRRRLPPPRGPAHRPGHHRRGQRLPARGRERAPRGHRCRGRRRLRRRRPPLGPAGVRRGRRRGHDRTRSARMPSRSLLRPSGPRTTSASPSSR